ncbi:MAG: LamG-like jellyroll fold domain-containing protein [Fuerstiella sp.]
MHRQVLLLIVALRAITPMPVMADWPTWQHDNRRTGTTDEQLQVSKLAPEWVWQSASPPQTAWSGPAKYDAYANQHNLPSMRNYDPVFHVIAVGDRVWFGSSADDSLYCLGAGDGKERWSVTADGPVRLAPTWSDGRVYFGSDDGYARCVKADDGQLVWKFTPADTSHLFLNNGRFIPFQPCRTGVVVDDGTAWFACAMLPWKDAWLCAVDAATGTTDDGRHFVKALPGRTMEGAPALSSKFLVLPQGRVAPRVFDRATGEDLGEMVKSGGGSVVVVSLDEDVFHGPATDSRKGGFRQSSGQSREVVAGLGRGNALVVDGSISWMLTDTEIIASSLTERKVLWKTACECPFAMIKAGDTLFVGGDQIVQAHSAKDGRLLRTMPATGRVFGLAASNGRLFASSDSGTIHCYATTDSVGSKPDDSSLVAAPAGEQPSLSDVAALEDDRLLGHWSFQKSTTTGTSVHSLHGPNLTLSRSPDFSRIGQYQALELDGASQTVMVSPDFRSVPVPTDQFTAEAWVRIDQLQEWGGIIGVVQDNGDEENGWLLGYRKNRFCIGLSSEDGPGRLTYLTADHDFEIKQWYHVAGSYDGTVMKLFVNGKLCAESSQHKGNIAYPERAWFEIGAYHDKDEYFRMRGAVHEVRLYGERLSDGEILSHYQSSHSRMPTKTVEASLASGPWLQFVDPQTAIVRWTTADPRPTLLQYGTDDLNQSVSDDTLRTEHQATLTELGRQRAYEYRIGIKDADPTTFTQTFECDNFFNYTPVSADRIPGVPNESTAELSRQILKSTSVRPGMCLVVGTIEDELLLQLCRDSLLRFVVADTDAANVSHLRSILRAHEVYGNQVAVHHVTDLSNLPFVGNWATTVLATGETDVDGLREIERHVRPDGGIALLMHPHSGDLPAHFKPLKMRDKEIWHRYLRPPLADAGEWSHLYGGPDNSAFAGEHLGGAKAADDLDVQWVGRPGPRYQADRSGRKPSPLSTGGRLFLQGLHRIIAVDHFNGTVLWSLEIPELERFNMPRDCSNWCANRDYLFVAVKDECWKIDTVSGEVVNRIAATDAASEAPMEWGYVATQDGRLYGSAVRAGTAWTSFWGGGDAGWYDARTGPVTFPICSDRLFCNDIETDELAWEYKRGVVLNSTITIGGDTMYFVESRNSEIMASKDRRVGDAKLWQDLHLVAIDATTGSPKWEKRLDPMSQQVVFYLAHAADQLTLVSSANTAFKVTSFVDSDGRARWTQTTEWLKGKGDHGKAMSRPAIVGDRLFLRPAVLSLKDGSVLPETMPVEHGCGTYACTADAVFMRSGDATMWDPENASASSWPRLRVDCWLSTIPAGGMLLSPEGGGGCSCGSWMETSVGFMPKVFDRRP